MIKFVFGKITRVWVMENRLESERGVEKHTQGGFAWLGQTQKRRKYSSASGQLPDCTEARVQGTDTYCVSKGSQCFKSESDLTQASGGLAEQAEGKEVAQVPGWTHTRGSLEHEDSVLVASYGVGRKALSGERPRGAAAVAQGGRERRCGDAGRLQGSGCPGA